MDPGVWRETEQRQEAEAVALRGSTAEQLVARPDDAGSAQEPEPELGSLLVHHGTASEEAES
jgi:hypothetical protein